eukprot:GHVO01051306.1.p1 GENE.GHVO01051306.1~~GHVO01051306.1.p1  ORF type:complete len:308 (-),score=77.18 GHVO01051306.1:144-1067(-)
MAHSSHIHTPQKMMGPIMRGGNVMMNPYEASMSQHVSNSTCVSNERPHYSYIPPNSPHPHQLHPQTQMPIGQHVSYSSHIMSQPPPRMSTSITPPQQHPDHIYRQDFNAPTKRRWAELSPPVGTSSQIGTVPPSNQIGTPPNAIGTPPPPKIRRRIEDPVGGVASGFKPLSPPRRRTPPQPPLRRPGVLGQQQQNWNKWVLMGKANAIMELSKRENGAHSNTPLQVPSGPAKPTWMPSKTAEEFGAILRSGPVSPWQALLNILLCGGVCRGLVNAHLCTLLKEGQNSLKHESYQSDGTPGNDATDAT